jgi:glc operon protein GlcG
MATRPGKLVGFLCFLPLVVADFCARAADRTLPVSIVSEAGAQQVLMAAEQEARKLAPCAIAVVDTSGILVAFLKMDGVRAGSPDLAVGKARTSALLQRPILPSHPGRQ